MQRCAKCNRALKDPKSIKRGFGPICWVKIQEDRKTNKEEQLRMDGFYDGGDIILRRVNGYATANVPHAIVFHSPAGFEWGYGGSGPADLALNILYAVTKNKELAMRYYQKFKWEFIAVLPEEGGIIKREEIIQWLRRHGCVVA